MATYEVPRALGALQIAEIGPRSGSYCGSLFLDLRFRKLVQKLLAAHSSHLDDASLAHFVLEFSASVKRTYKGPENDAEMFSFRCLHRGDSGEQPLLFSISARENQ